MRIENSILLSKSEHVFNQESDSNLNFLEKVYEASYFLLLQYLSRMVMALREEGAQGELQIKYLPKAV